MAYSKRKTLLEMQPILLRWSASSLSKKAFCIQEGLKIHVLDYWLRSQNVAKVGADKGGAFIALSPIEEQGSVFRSVAQGLEIVLPNGVRIHAQSKLSVELLNMLANV